MKQKINNLSNRINRTTNFREPSVVETFYKRTFRPIYGKSAIVKFIDDVYMLFNQQRLDSSSVEALVNSLNRTRPADDPLASIRAKLTDKQLCQFVKSRFIQTRSELLSYTQYIDSNYEQLRSELDAQIAQQSASEPPAQQN